MLAPNFTPFPILNTNRFELRKITEGDIAELFVLRSDERVMEYIDRPRAKTNDDVVSFINIVNDAIDKNDGINWAICEKGNSKLIGVISFWRIEKQNYRAEIGYTLHPNYWKKGVMSEVIKEVIDYGFKVMKLHSIEANINPDNKGSQKLLEKNGFFREAYFKENFYWEGKFLDSAVYSLRNPND